MRKLATIQKIWKLEPIPDADRIELAHVLGWQCVVNRGQFKPMELGVYFEIDSFLPVRPEFEFMRANSYKKSEFLGEGFRIRTLKFRGQISQGLILPVSAFPELAGMEITEAMDVTEILGVRKWEIPERLSTQGTIIGELPTDVPKTDETRVQAEPELIKEFHGLEYYISTKMDGSSHSCSIDEDGVFHVTGHNYEYKDDGKSDLYNLLKERELESKMRKLMQERGIRALVLQGEFCGEGIQQNRLKLKKPEWYVFTVRIDGHRAGLKTMQDICEALDLLTVPIEEVGMDLDEKYPTVEALLERADGEYPNGGKKEGIVIRPTEPVFSTRISAALSMKVVSNKYLLKNDQG